MLRISSSLSPEELGKRIAPQLPAMDAALPQRHGADLHLWITNEEGETLARCSLWWTHVPEVPGERPGMVGHFAAVDETSSRELLDAACNRLREAACTVAIGPMDGNTWRSYRFVTERGEEAPFLMEPTNPEPWPGYWEKAGFAPLAAYFSALNSNLDWEDPQVTRAGERLLAAGITVRPLHADDFHEELRRIFRVSLVAFTSNYLYTPATEEQFLAQYTSVKDRIRPELVLLAERAGEPVGYVFSIPDWLRGAQTDTTIVKTVAVLPGRQYAGLGTWLVALAQIAARNLGYKRCIHALMHESNNSLNLSARYAKVFRRYTLFSRKL